MENYQTGINFKETKCIPRNYMKGMMNSNYNLGEYRQKYLHTSTAESMYNNFVKYLQRGSHIGKYEPPK
jgi:hypothetical protein